MTTYIIRRLLIIIPTFILITILVFLFIDLAPGDYVAVLTTSQISVSPSMIESYEARFKLGQPVWKRYLYWSWNVLHGDFGISLITGERVAGIVIPRLLNTVWLMSFALVISTVLGLVVGIISGIWQYSLLDYVSTLIIFFGLSIPSFFLGYGLIYLFAVNIPFFPVQGSISSVGHPSTFAWVSDRLYHTVLPASALGFKLAAFIARYTRTSILEVLRAQYVDTARAKGLPEQLVLLKHVLRNALSPIVTVLSQRLRRLISGSIVIEIVFGWPGIGSLLRDAVLQRNYTVLMAAIMLLAGITLFAFLLADIAYAVVNPKVRYT